MRHVCVDILDAARGVAMCRIVLSFSRVYRVGVWFGFVRFALLLAVVLGWVNRYFDSWVLLGLFCLFRVKHHTHIPPPRPQAVACMCVTVAAHSGGHHLQPHTTTRVCVVVPLSQRKSLSALWCALSRSSAAAAADTFTRNTAGSQHTFMNNVIHNISQTCCRNSSRVQGAGGGPRLPSLASPPGVAAASTVYKPNRPGNRTQRRRVWTHAGGCARVYHLLLALLARPGARSPGTAHSLRNLPGMHAHRAEPPQRAEPLTWLRSQILHTHKYILHVALAPCLTLNRARSPVAGQDVDDGDVLHGESY